MKKYETPYAEKVEFDYKDQVVAASGDRPVDTHYQSTGQCSCNDSTTPTT